MLQNLIFYTICLEAKIDISGTGVLPLIYKRDKKFHARCLRKVSKMFNFRF